MLKIDIVLPVFNEEPSLERQVHKASLYIRENLPDLGTIGLVIADNGSTDQTADIAKHLAQSNQFIRFVQVARPGVGLALRTAWLQSEADIVGFMDLDLATDLSHLRQALEPLAHDVVDVVAGSRLKPGSRVLGRSLKREITSRSFNLIIRWYLGAAFSDGMCGFKFLQRKHLSAIIEEGAVSEGWFFSTELLVCAQHLGLRLLDLPVTWTDGPNSKAQISKLAVHYILAMRRLKALHHSKLAP